MNTLKIFQKNFNSKASPRPSEGRPPFAGFEKTFLDCNFVPIGPSIDFIAPAYHNLTMLSRMEVNSSL